MILFKTKVIFQMAINAAIKREISIGSTSEGLSQCDASNKAHYSRPYTGPNTGYSGSPRFRT
jgi:hypothetical protein